ncbi:hypothetical protein VINE108274_17180 [Vibrio neptunius]
MSTIKLFGRICRNAMTGALESKKYRDDPDYRQQIIDLGKTLTLRKIYINAGKNSNIEYRGAELIFDIDGRIKRSNNVKFEVMKTVHQHDQEAYRKAMYRALEMHKEWWTHDEDFSQRVQGYISLPLLTAAKYAYEKHGFTLDFECGYLPSYIYLS